MTAMLFMHARIDFSNNLKSNCSIDRNFYKFEKNIQKKHNSAKKEKKFCLFPSHIFLWKVSGTVNIVY